MMAKKIKKKKQIKTGKIMDTIHYTEDSYFQCFPKATDDDYFNYLMQDDLEYVLLMEERYDDLYISGIRKIVIDHQYFSYLKKEKQKNTSENRIKYGNSLSDDEVHKLWRKNDMEMATMVRVIPFIIASKNILPVYNVALSEELLNEIKHTIALSVDLKKEQLYFHQELLRADFCNEEFLEEEFYSSAHNYFVTGNEERLKNIPFIGKQTNQTIIFRFLPVAIKDIETAIVSRKELEKELWVEKTLPEHSIIKWAQKACANLGNDLNIKVIPTFLDQMEIEDFCDDFIESLKENSKIHGVNIVNAK
jgi:hypothetical protein